MYTLDNCQELWLTYLFVKISTDWWRYIAEYRLADDDPAVAVDDVRLTTLSGIMATCREGLSVMDERGWTISLVIGAGNGVHQLIEATSAARQIVIDALRDAKMPVAALVREETDHAPSHPREATALLDGAALCTRLAISRQRLHQLRQTEWFPAPTTSAGARPLWSARDIDAFEATWVRRSGRKPHRGSVRL